MGQYFHRSKCLAHSFVFILPLLVLYEVGIVMCGSGIKNTADVIMKIPLSIFGRDGSLVFNLLVIFFLLVSIFYIEKKHRLNTSIFVPMSLESLIYALFIGYGIGFLVYRVLFPYHLATPFSMDKWLGIVLSVGAGVYEEIVFRLVLISVLYFFFTGILKVVKPIGAAMSILLGALIFTFVHYVGTLGDSFAMSSFAFRLLSGVFLSAVFMFRGLGIAVYTHAIYDVFSVLRPFQV